MKRKTKEYISQGGIMILILLLFAPLVTTKEKNVVTKKELLGDSMAVIENASVAKIEPIVYENMTMKELSIQIDKSLTSTVSGKGYLFASYALEKGVDPYLATAIMLHETGCKWGCSTLVKKCNNVGGQKGGPTCGSGSYAKFSTLDDGIKIFIDNISNNYVAKGLNTPKSMQRKYVGYAASDWAVKVDRYMLDIKSK